MKVVDGNGLIVGKVLQFTDAATALLEIIVNGFRWTVQINVSDFISYRDQPVFYESNDGTGQPYTCISAIGPPFLAKAAWIGLPEWTLYSDDLSETPINRYFESNAPLATMAETSPSVTVQSDNGYSRAVVPVINLVSYYQEPFSAVED